MTIGQKSIGSCLRGSAHRNDPHVYHVLQTLYICRQVRKQFGSLEFLYILPLCSYCIIKKQTPISIKIGFLPLQKCPWNGRTRKQLEDTRLTKSEGTFKTTYRWNTFRKDFSKL